MASVSRAAVWGSTAVWGKGSRVRRRFPSPIQNTGVVSGGAVGAAVGDGGIGGSHLQIGDAAAGAAQRQCLHPVGVGEVGKAKRGQLIPHRVHPHLLEALQSHGVQRRGDGGAHRGASGVGAAGVADGRAVGVSAGRVVIHRAQRGIAAAEGGGVFPHHLDGNC